MKPIVGTFLSIGSPVIVELASLSGFDWVLIDLEHGDGAMPKPLAQRDGERKLKASPAWEVIELGFTL